MQGMKTDTASIRIEDRSCQQMIQVHQHGSQHDTPRPLPCIPEEHKSNHARRKHMQGKVDTKTKDICHL